LWLLLLLLLLLLRVLCRTRPTPLMRAAAACTVQDMANTFDALCVGIVHMPDAGLAGQCNGHLHGLAVAGSNCAAVTAICIVYAVSLCPR
jgi:hypothetical protein